MESATSFCLTLAGFFALDLPAVVELLGPLFLAKSIGMLVAPRGCGKSLLAGLIAYAIAAGKPVFPWGTGSGDHVLYIDGEMRAAGLRDRFLQLHKFNTSQESQEQVLKRLHIISRDVAGDVIGSLDTLEGLASFDTLIPAPVRFIVIDNYASLTGSGSEGPEKFAILKQWLVRKRLDGVAVLLLHHTGKSGTQRGSSTHEDLLDYVIQLSPRNEPGKTAFTLRHTKLRDHLPLLKGDFDGAFWTDGEKMCFKIAAAEKYARPEDAAILEMRKQGHPFQKIADEVGLSKATVQRRYKELQASQAELHAASTEAED
ncbi:AAA family ATPase [Paraburkholderia sp. BCC1885]|uniref:AAA family ATPase n=1 Tax=Paraburkholderia sp. BCC1885 TaxID=2562669 RepID=UPI001182A1BD|nr:AAA family ATPase [Paraburkholderia sp. BCC1885]